MMSVALLLGAYEAAQEVAGYFNRKKSSAEREVDRLYGANAPEQYTDPETGETWYYNEETEDWEQ